MDLEQVLNKSEGGMNWGVISIYSCSNSCNLSREECVVIQDSIDENPEKMDFQQVANANNENESDCGDGKW